MTNERDSSRRHFLSTFLGGTLAATGAGALPAAAAGQPEQSPASAERPFTVDPNDPVAHYWDKSLAELVDIGPLDAPDQEDERHRIYAYVVAALLHGYFNGSRNGEIGDYPWQPSQRIQGSGTHGVYRGGRYLGHNICAIAVDGNGEIIDFDFNHNAIFNSSVEHAEARLIKRLFSLAEIQDGWNVRAPRTPAPLTAVSDNNYGTTLSNVTIYTSLESCAQCSGIMTLANIKRVVFLQTDPSQYQIGRIMYRLSRPVGDEDSPGAPRPISGTEIGLDLTARIDADYKTYYEAVGIGPGQQPFFKPPGSDNDPALWKASRSITSFLCTDLALASYEKGRTALDTLTLLYPDYRPNDGGDDVRSNAEVLTLARLFLDYAITKGRRGTPHR